MTTLTGPNLNIARLQLEKLMDDECVIVRNPLGERDATYDRNTLRITPSATAVVYDASTVSNVTDPDSLYASLIGRSLAGASSTGGKCKLSSLRDSQPTSNDELNSTVDSRYYRFAVPVDAPELAIGDIVTVTNSPRWPTMVGHQFQIRELIDSTFAVQQRCVAERRVWQGAGDTVPASTPGTAVPGITGGTPILSGGSVPIGVLVAITGIGRAVVYDQQDLTANAFGIASNAVSGAGQTIYVVVSGFVTVSSWSLTPGERYYAGAGGVLTTTPPTTGMLQAVGVALSPTTLNVEIEAPVVL